MIMENLNVTALMEEMVEDSTLRLHQGHMVSWLELGLLLFTHRVMKARDTSKDDEVTLGEVHQSTDGESESGEEVGVGGEKKVQPASKIKSPEKNQRQSPNPARGHWRCYPSLTTPIQNQNQRGK